VGDIQPGTGGSLVRRYYTHGVAYEAFSRSHAKDRFIREIVLAQLGTVRPQQLLQAALSIRDE
jgi:hypothetical protein